VPPMVTAWDRFFGWLAVLPRGLGALLDRAPLIAGIAGLCLLLAGVGMLAYTRISPWQQVGYLDSQTPSEDWPVVGVDLPRETPTPPPETPYRAEVTVDGPERLRFGTSARIELRIQVYTNTAPLASLVGSAVPLAQASGYSSTVRIQPGNFEVSEGVADTREIQPLGLTSPARWAWIIAPKEKRLGAQEILFDVFITDRSGVRVGAPYSHARVYVSDPLGIAPGVVYLVTAVGGLTSVPLWTWVYSEWSTRQKEKRERRQRREDESDMEILRP
jgi:hypothetical protein